MVGYGHPLLVSRQLSCTDLSLLSLIENWWFFGSAAIAWRGSEIEDCRLDLKSSVMRVLLRGGEAVPAQSVSHAGGEQVAADINGTPGHVQEAVHREDLSLIHI